MSLDKKAILKEIEVLIRSIKVHYDNIEHEYRIPSIELELITSKIRKLHEKSIIYNHLHYMEEEQLQSAKRLKLDHIIFKHATEENELDNINLQPQINELYSTHIKFEEKVAAMENEAEKAIEQDVKVVPTAITEPVKEESSKEAESAKKAEEPVVAAMPEPQIAADFKQINLHNKIGINDRFRFIKNLFAGNGAALEEAITAIEQCTSTQALNNCVDKLKKNNQWNEEDENVIDFMALLI